MPTISRGFIQQAELANEISKAAELLDPRDVLDVRFSLDTDWSGEPAIFFGILLSSHGSKESRLAEVTGKVSTTLFDTLQPYNRWGLQPYFNFTSDRAHHGRNEWI